MTKTYYCYEITFDDGCLYYGSRACDGLPKDDILYNGSPGAAIRDKWQTNSYQKRVLGCFSTAVEARAAEKQLIRKGWLLHGQACINTAVTTVRKGKFMIVDRHGYIINRG